MYIKEIAIALLVAALAYVTYDYLHQRGVISTQKQKIKEQAEVIEDAKGKLKVYAEAVVEADKAVKEASKQRQKVITKYQDRIVTVQQQTPPTECQKVIEWSIERLPDLRWSLP